MFESVDALKDGRRLDGYPISSGELIIIGGIGRGDATTEFVSSIVLLCNLVIKNDI